MASQADAMPVLAGIVELDEKYLGGKPRYQKDVKHKRGKGTAKSCVAAARAIGTASCVSAVMGHFANVATSVFL
jgi:hypothetical protein